jgi:hypothetical protein
MPLKGVFKDKILEFLNEVPYASNRRGIVQRPDTTLTVTLIP